MFTSRRTFSRRPIRCFERLRPTGNSEPHGRRLQDRVGPGYSDPYELSGLRLERRRRPPCAVTQQRDVVGGDLDRDSPVEPLEACRDGVVVDLPATGWGVGIALASYVVDVVVRNEVAIARAETGDPVVTVLQL